MICQEKVNENGKITNKETRVHVSESNQFGGLSSLFGNLFRGIETSEDVLQSRFDQLERDFARDFDKIQTSFLPFFMAFNP